MAAGGPGHSRSSGEEHRVGVLGLGAVMGLTARRMPGLLSPGACLPWPQFSHPAEEGVGSSLSQVQ